MGPPVPRLVPALPPPPIRWYCAPRTSPSSTAAPTVTALASPKFMQLLSLPSSARLRCFPSAQVAKVFKLPSLALQPTHPLIHGHAVSMSSTHLLSVVDQQHDIVGAFEAHAGRQGWQADARVQNRAAATAPTVQQCRQPPRALNPGWGGAPAPGLHCSKLPRTQPRRSTSLDGLSMGQGEGSPQRLPELFVSHAGLGACTGSQRAGLSLIT